MTASHGQSALCHRPATARVRAYDPRPVPRLTARVQRLPSSGEIPSAAGTASFLTSGAHRGHGVDFIVIGEVAAILEGVAITTLDLDVIQDRSPENLERLIAVLAEGVVTPT